jgi:hypothetical protein
MKPRSFIVIFALFTASYAITLVPDSSSVTIQPMSSINTVIDSVKICNSDPASITIDSIIIKFLNGDSSDFARGKNCDPANFFQYFYGGWVFGASNKSLRYIRDSVFLLQDSLGAPVAISIGANSCITFPLREITNCPVCGRMPSFPKTTRYSYTFFTSGGNKVFIFKINDMTPVSYGRVTSLLRYPAIHKTAACNLLGRNVKGGNAAGFEMRNGEKRVKAEGKEEKIK